MKRQTTCCVKNTCVDPIAVEEFPCRAGLRAVGLFDGVYPEDDLEYEAYWDFIRWVFQQDILALVAVPGKPADSGFHGIPLDELSRPDSAFNTVDFAREHPDRFDGKGYRLAKILERVEDLAIQHSCVSHEESRRNIYRKYLSLVDREFRERALAVGEALKSGDPRLDRKRLSAELWKLNEGIGACHRVWNKYADWPEGLPAFSGIQPLLSCQALGGGYA